VRVRGKIIGIAVLVVCVAAGIYSWWNFVPSVPRANGGSFTVKLGARKTQVLAACGSGCGRGDVPKGACGSDYQPQGFIKSLR